MRFAPFPSAPRPRERAAVRFLPSRFYRADGNCEPAERDKFDGRRRAGRVAQIDNLRAFCHDDRADELIPRYNTSV